MGFENDEEWTPPPMKDFSRNKVYKPRIDLIWYRNANEQFVNFLNFFQDQEFTAPYKDFEKDVIIGFELELSDRATKYILGDISNLSRMCDFGFIVIKNLDNLVERSKKASKAFSILHGKSNVFVIDPEELDEIISKIEHNTQIQTKNGSKTRL